MTNSVVTIRFQYWMTHYGMLFVLAILCLFFSLATIKEQMPTGASAARQVFDALPAVGAEDGANAASAILIVTGETNEERIFSEELSRLITKDEATQAIPEIVFGEPADARQALEKRAAEKKATTVLVLSSDASQWKFFENIGDKFPELSDAQIVAPAPYLWPNFLKSENLLNITNQIVVVAIIAVGMTFVIITGGVDLSVGSLIALGAVLTVRMIRDVGGGVEASNLTVFASGLLAIGICGLVGLFSGSVITLFRIPPFIATLAMMLMASGAAYLLAEGQSNDKVPDSFIWLGRGKLLGFPLAVWLMFLLYAGAHFLMSRMTFGRCVYAVGGNREAARLSGIAVKRVIVTVYVLSGIMAGLGGVIMASQLDSGAPMYGNTYELYVIAAVVVGGTSLQGGEGKILGTLVGALIIAVIRNGMNLLGVDSYTQNVILGAVILSAVCFDNLKNSGTSRTD
jgi:ribose transport system permease protein